MNKKYFCLFPIFLCLLILSQLLFSQPPADIKEIENKDCSLLTKGIKSSKNEAKYLNKMGFRTYKKKNYVKAAQYFFCAIKYDKKHVIAHYNYACMLSLLRKELSVCNLDYLDTIAKHLKIAIQVDPKRRERMQKDSDLKNIRELPFYTLLTISPKKKIKDILTGIGTWYGPQPGVYPHSPEVTFYKKGIVKFKHFVLSEDGRSDWKNKIFRYTLKNRNIIIHNPKTKRVVYNAKIILKIEKGVVTGLYIKLNDHMNINLYSVECGV